MAYWLLKSEPDDWSWAEQVAKGRQGAEWTGIRNFSAQNHLRAMKKGEQAFFYHTGKERAIVGIVKVIGRRIRIRPTQPGAPSTSPPCGSFRRRSASTGSRRTAGSPAWRWSGSHVCRSSQFRRPSGRSSARWGDSDDSPRPTRPRLPRRALHFLNSDPDGRADPAGWPSGPRAVQPARPSASRVAPCERHGACDRSGRSRTADVVSRAPTHAGPSRTPADFRDRPGRAEGEASV